MPDALTTTTDETKDETSDETSDETKDEPTVARRDPRAARTRAALHRALLDLAGAQGLSGTSVAQLTAAAGVNRATFYLHYADLDALLLDALGAVIGETAAGAAQAPQAELDDPHHAPAHTLAFFRELAVHAPLYREILGPSGSAAAVAHLRAGMEATIAEELSRRLPRGRDLGAPVDVLAPFLAGAIFGAATAWLERDPREEPDDVAAAVWRLVTATVAGSADTPRPDTRGEP